MSSRSEGEDQRHRQQFSAQATNDWKNQLEQGFLVVDDRQLSLFDFISEDIGVTFNLLGPCTSLYIVDAAFLHTDHEQFQSRDEVEEPYLDFAPI